MDILPTLDPRPIDEIQSREIMPRRRASKTAASAHTEQSKVKRAYDRGDRYEERTRVMQWWRTTSIPWQRDARSHADEHSACWPMRTIFLDKDTTGLGTQGSICGGLRCRAGAWPTA